MPGNPNGNPQNLIPVTKGSIEARLLAQKGGLQRTQAKKDAQRWNALKARMKKKAITDEDAKWMIQKLENRDMAAADILMYLEEIKRDIHPGQRVALANAMANIATFQHGAKVKTENVNINVNTTIEEFEKRLLNDEDVDVNTLRRNDDIPNP